MARWTVLHRRKRRAGAHINWKGFVFTLDRMVRAARESMKIAKTPYDVLRAAATGAVLIAIKQRARERERTILRKRRPL